MTVSGVRDWKQMRSAPRNDGVEGAEQGGEPRSRGEIEWHALFN